MKVELVEDQEHNPSFVSLKLAYTSAPFIWSAVEDELNVIRIEPFVNENSNFRINSEEKIVVEKR